MSEPSPTPKAKQEVEVTTPNPISTVLSESEILSRVPPEVREQIEGGGGSEKEDSTTAERLGGCGECDYKGHLPSGRYCDCEYARQRQYQDMCAVEGRFPRAGVPDRLKGLSLQTLSEVAPSAAETQAARAVRALEENGEVTDPCHGTKRGSLCLLGRNGTGKSGLLVHLARQHFLAGQIPLWIKYADLVRDGVQAGYGTSVEYAPGLQLSTVRLQAAQRVDVLLIDDLGDPFAPADSYVETSDRRDILFRILSARHEEGLPTHITSNHRSLEEIREQFDPRTADRVKELCAVVEMDGPNLREIQ